MIHHNEGSSQRPLVQMTGTDIIVRENHLEDSSKSEAHILILTEVEPIGGTARTFEYVIPEDVEPELHTAFHCGVKRNRTLPRALENLAAQVGLHLRRAVLYTSSGGFLEGEILTLSDLTGVVDGFRVAPEEAILFAFTHGLPIFMREDLLESRDEQMRSIADAEELEGKEFLKMAIRSGQLPEEFSPEKTIVAIANLRRSEVIELIELAEKLEYYEWAYHLSAFIDLDETILGGMDV